MHACMQSFRYSRQRIPRCCCLVYSSNAWAAFWGSKMLSCGKCQLLYNIFKMLSLLLLGCVRLLLVGGLYRWLWRWGGIEAVAILRATLLSSYAFLVIKECTTYAAHEQFIYLLYLLNRMASACAFLILPYLFIWSFLQSHITLYRCQQ